MAITEPYCQACAHKPEVHGHLLGRPPEPLASTYQLGKFLKHTILDPRVPVLSLFDDRSREKYQRYIVTTATAGSVYRDPNHQGRLTIIWFAGERVGLEVRCGTISQPGAAPPTPPASTAVTPTTCL